MKKGFLLVLVIVVIPLIQGEEWQSYECEHFIFYYNGDHLTTEDLMVIAQNQEDLFSTICDLLEIEYTGKITYYLYGDRTDFEGIPGAYCIGKEIRFLCIFCVDFCKQGLYDAHEMTHALANEIGFQYGLLAEGLAVYVEDYYIGEMNLHGIVNILYTEDRLTSLEDLIDEFWCDILFNYDISGSFTAFLIEEYGIEKYKEVYSMPLDSLSFEAVYGKSLAVLEAEWIAVIQHAEVTQEEKDIVRYRDNIKEGLQVYFDLGFSSFEHATYPAKAEEGICLFRETYKDDSEKAFSYLPQFNEGMAAWSKAVETFEKALKEPEYQVKADLFEEAASLYEVAGDEAMIELSTKYGAAYHSLQATLEYINCEEVELAENELSKATVLFEELENPEELSKVREHIQLFKDQNIEEFNAFIVLILIFTELVWAVEKLK